MKIMFNETVKVIVDEDNDIYISRQDQHGGMHDLFMTRQQAKKFARKVKKAVKKASA